MGDTLPPKRIPQAPVAIRHPLTGLNVLQEGQGLLHHGHRGDVIVTLYDVWVLGDIDAPALSWTPVDHDPVPPDVLRHALRRNVQTLAMSRFGHRAFADAGGGSELERYVYRISRSLDSLVHGMVYCIL